MAEGGKRGLVEVIGAIGVIGSLVFVGLEIRESSRATRAATDAEIAAQFVELNTAVYSSGELLDAFAEVGELRDPALASVQSQAALSSFYRALFYVWSNAHRQHLLGSSGGSIFESVIQEVAAYASPEVEGETELNARRRHMQWAWEIEGFLYNPDFRGFMDSIIAAQR